MTNSPSPPTYQSTHLPPTNPYVGPRTFSAEQRHLFFGREREARDLLARVLSERLLLFYAQSGAGKSSLLHARLIPRLQEEKGFVVLPVGRVSGELPVGVAQVDNIFVFNLLLSLDEVSEAELLAQVSLGDFLARLARRSVVDADGEERKGWVYDPELAPSAAGAAPGARRYALIVDQFEEIITSHPARWREREDFFRQLDAALTADPNLWVVLTLREDYVAALDPYAELCFNRLRARFYMERMDGTAALEAIRRPAELGGRPFAAGVAEQLVDNLRQVRVPGQETTVAGQYVEPVQLQVVCWQMWENLEKGKEGKEGKEGEEITLKDLAVAGDVNQALTAFYEETLAAALADPAAAGVSERQVRAWFDEQLITKAGTRGLVHQGERESGGLPNGVVRALQRQFLLRGEARGGDVWIELVHDRFVEPIRASNAAWFPQHLSALQRQTELWIEQGRPSGLLWRDAALAEAEVWASGHPEEVGDGERQFLEACRQAQQAVERERRDSRRIRLLALVAAIVAVVAMIAAIYGIWGQQQAAKATRMATDLSVLAATQAADAVVAQGTAVAESLRADAEAEDAGRQRVIAEQKAIEANKAARSAQAHNLAARAQAALSAVPADPSLALLLASEAVQTTWTEDGVVSQFVSQALLDTMRQVALRPSLLPRHRHEGPINFAAYSPDGALLLTASDDRTVKLWTADDGELVATLSGHGGPVNMASFSPDGLQVVSASADRTVCLWAVPQDRDARSMLVQSTRTIEGHDNVVRSALFSTDGSQVLTASDDGSARLWDAANGREIARVQEAPYRILWAAYSPNGSHIITADEKGVATIWDSQARNEPVTLTGHSNRIRSALFSPDGNQVVTASDDGTVRVWDAASGASLLPPFSVPAASPWAAFATFSPDGRSIAAISSKETGGRHEVSVWNSETGEKTASWLGPLRMPRSVVFSPDGARLLTGGLDNAMVWRLTTNAAGLIVGAEQEPVLDGHESWVFGAAFSPDGRQVVTAGDDWLVKVWDVATGAEQRTLTGHEGRVTSAVFSADGLQILTASRDGTVRLWDAATGRQLADPIRPGPDQPGLAWFARYSPDGALIATGTDAGALVLWDAATRQELRRSPQEEQHSKIIRHLSFSPDGRQIVTASEDREAKVWDAATGRLITTLQGHTGAVFSARYRPDGAQIATASQDGTVRLWDSVSGDVKVTLVGHGPGLFGTDGVIDAAFSPAEPVGTGSGRQLLASAGLDGTVRLWDAATGKALQVLTGHTSEVRSVDFSLDGSKIVSTGGSRDGTARIWDLTSAPYPLLLRGHRSQVFSAAFNLDGTRVVTGASYDEVKVWDAKTGKEALPTLQHNDWIYFAAFSPDGQQILALQDTRQPAIVLWDATSGARLREFALQSHTPGKHRWSAMFSPDGGRIVTASEDGTARIWDARIGEELLALTGHEGGVFWAMFSPDGERVVTASGDRTARVWNARTGEELQVLRGHGDVVWAAAFSPDGRQVVTASYDDTARIWDLAGGRVRHVLAGHLDNVRSAVFSPHDDGAFVLTASDDGTARVWDAKNGQELFTAARHNKAIRSATYSQDGRYIVTASQDGTAAIWPATIAGQIEAARNLVQRDPPLLTPHERQRYGLE